jgi:hypothetical protein
MLILSNYITNYEVNNILTFNIHNIGHIVNLLDLQIECCFHTRNKILWKKNKNNKDHF